MRVLLRKGGVLIFKISFSQTVSISLLQKVTGCINQTTVWGFSFHYFPLHFFGICLQFCSKKLKKRHILKKKNIMCAGKQCVNTVGGGFALRENCPIH